MRIEPTVYYDEFLRYFEMAKDQQEKCNTSTKPPHGMIDHADSEMNDDLMEKVIDRCRDAGNVLSTIVLKYS